MTVKKIFKLEVVFRVFCYDIQVILENNVSFKRNLVISMSKRTFVVDFGRNSFLNQAWKLITNRMVHSFSVSREYNRLVCIVHGNGSVLDILGI